jgi:hypothetical protein
MDDQTFLKRFNSWEVKLSKKEQSDYSKYDALCALYLEATLEQRIRLLEFLTRYDTLPDREWIGKLKSATYGDLLGELTVYMRWDSKRIKTQDDGYALRLGLAAAAIIGEGLDNRDVTVSLAFLYFAAKQAGLDPVPQFKAIAETARPEAKELILAFLKRNEAKIRNDLNLDYFYKVEEEIDLPYREIDLD